MSDLASNSKRSLALLLFASACSTTQTGDVGTVPSPQENAPRAQEFRIAPPMSMGEAEEQQQREKIQQLLSGESNADGLSEVQLPAAAFGLQPNDVSNDPIAQARQRARVQRTDAEIAASSGAGEFEKKLGDVDRMLDVSEEAERPMTPSFTIQSQKIRELFQKNRYEDALVETNELLIHYPRSGLLWTMKGTLHLRLSQNDLSLAAYEKAFDIEPSQRLLAQIEDLRRIVSERETLRRQRSPVPKTDSSSGTLNGGQK